jgi:hypothetical protein
MTNLLARFSKTSGRLERSVWANYDYVRWRTDYASQ